MQGLLTAVFWLSGTALYVLGCLFGLHMWDLGGLIAFAVIPPLELLLPFIAWFVTGVFPGLIFAIWVVQVVAMLGMAAAEQ